MKGSSESGSSVGVDDLPGILLDVSERNPFQHLQLTGMLYSNP